MSSVEQKQMERRVSKILLEAPQADDLYISRASSRAL